MVTETQSDATQCGVIGDSLMEESNIPTSKPQSLNYENSKDEIYNTSTSTEL